MSEDRVSRRRVPRGGRRCRGCDRYLSEGADAYYRSDDRTWACPHCQRHRTPTRSGVAGASAGDAARRLRRHPRQAAAFARGQEGEQTLAAVLAAGLTGTPARLLHDLAVPGGDANIDHVVVASAGVFVLDAKHVSGPVELVREGWFDHRRFVLRVRGKDRADWIEALQRQVSIVREVLDGRPFAADVRGVLCLVDGDFRTLGYPTVQDVWVTRPSVAATRIRESAVDARIDLDVVAAQVLEALPPRRYRPHG